MIVSAIEQAGHVRHGQPDEGNGATPGGGNGREEAGDEEQQMTRVGDVDTQIACCCLAQHPAVERFDEKGAGEQADKGEGNEEPEPSESHTVEIAHAPEHQALHTVGRGIISHERDGGRGEVAEQDTHDEQRDVVTDVSAEEQQQAKHRKGTDERSHDKTRAEAYGQRAESHSRTARQHDDGHHEVGAAGDAQDGRTRQRIAEITLQQQATDTQRGSRQRGSDGGWQATLKDDEVPAGVKEFAARDGHRAEEDVGNDGQEVEEN